MRLVRAAGRRRCAASVARLAGGPAAGAPEAGPLEAGWGRPARAATRPARRDGSAGRARADRSSARPPGRTRRRRRRGRAGGRNDGACAGAPYRSDPVRSIERACCTLARAENPVESVADLGTAPFELADRGRAAGGPTRALPGGPAKRLARDPTNPVLCRAGRNERTSETSLWTPFPESPRSCWPTSPART